MRTETREVTVEKEIYIAEDGTEFDDKDECEEYEMQYAEEALKLYDDNGAPCENLDSCVYANLDTWVAVETLLNVCKYYGIDTSGIKEPGLYTCVYGIGNNSWCNLSEMIRRIKESEDTVSGN